jgi:hypothetical protein
MNPGLFPRGYSSNEKIPCTDLPDGGLRMRVCCLEYFFSDLRIDRTSGMEEGSRISYISESKPIDNQFFVGFDDCLFCYGNFLRAHITTSQSKRDSTEGKP